MNSSVQAAGLLCVKFCHPVVDFDCFQRYNSTVKVQPQKLEAD